ncbi:MAG: hypothetical protein AUJ48_04300 [Deltaproteobacteria bacterium CG1_02_45_11]|nr:MAG: hypothetical protein AUJ48_04300 [Deltaproteobacteria bacterium CG1_02_45_11]
MQKIDFILYLISTFLGSAGAWVIAKWGMKLSLSDKPNSRSSHNTITVKGGGIGILAAFVFVSLFISIPKSFWIPAALLSVFSLLGDRFEILPNIRLPVQFAAAFSFLLTLHISVLSTKSFSLLSFSPLALYSLSISALCLLFLSVFIVGTTNFYNFMDGINGIAGITGIVGFGLIAFFAFITGTDSYFITLSVCISFSCLGFLPFNFPKARVFMGDVGSILLGFVFSGMVILLSRNLRDFICLASFLFPFYADELITMVVRLKNGAKLSQPHRRHLYQLLANEYQVPHWKVSVGYGVAQLFVGLSIIFIENSGGLAIVSVLVFYFCCFIGVSYVFRHKLSRRI